MHWPGPYLTKEKVRGKWQQAKKPFHGEKWKLPQVVHDYFAEAAGRRTYAGRNIALDVTRLRHCFGDLPCFDNIRTLDIKRLRITTQYQDSPSGDSLGQWLQRVTGLKLADKGNKSVRQKGWNSLDPLPEKQKHYACLDGIASYVLGMEYFTPGRYQKCHHYHMELASRNKYDKVRVRLG